MDTNVPPSPSVLQVMANIMSLSAPELRLQGLFLVIVWFCLAFR